jgi:7-cyano-7-deazaguanine synthase in queuosine biosynthesis
VTYVPARNLVFLSLTLAWAEAVGALDIFIGVNALDYSGYPDCRPEFISGFTELARLATKAGDQGASSPSMLRCSIWARPTLPVKQTGLGWMWA